MKFDKNTVDKLEDFNKWNAGKVKEDHINLFDYATFNATPDLIMSFAELFNPEIIEYKGSFFFNYDFDSEIYKQWEVKGLSSVEIERVMNHVHMSLFFQNEDDLEYDILFNCAKIITSFWTKMFSDKGLVGEVIEGDICDLAITFHS